MARIFTTSFEFNHQKYDAIVTIITHETGPEFHVRFLNPATHVLIPQGELRYEGLNGYSSILELDNTVAQSFMRSLSTAIQLHMKEPENQP